MNNSLAYLLLMIIGAGIFYCFGDLTAITEEEIGEGSIPHRICGGIHYVGGLLFFMGMMGCYRIAKQECVTTHK